MDNTIPTQAGAALVAALARRDFQGMAALMAPGAQLRALLPGRIVDDRDGGRTLAGHLAGWFGGDGAFAVDDADVGSVGERASVRWRVRMTPPSGASRILEQHAFLAGDNRIHQLDLLCSGWQPARSRVSR